MRYWRSFALLGKNKTKREKNNQNKNKKRTLMNKDKAINLK
jgi:hypothetical protein